jgi:integrase/recombinase XerD
MSTLFEELDRYLTVRRSLGYALRTDERILRRFIVFAEQEGADTISTDLFLRWQAACSPVRRQTWARRLGIIRLFTQWLHGIDPRHEIPPQGLIPSHQRRPRPYIYSEEDIRRIIEAAGELPSVNGIRALTCSTLFGLIAVTGLRVSEALSLEADDVDLDAGVLTIRQGKRGKERLLPLADSTTAQLAAYATERDRLLGRHSKPFFVSDRGGRLTDCGARYNFAAVCRNIGLRHATKFHRHGHGPRIHDLRHSFAVRTLINWYKTDRNPGREMIKLCTWLGHTDPAHTYWYIEAVPELLELASRRAADSLAGEVTS